MRILLLLSLVSVLLSCENVQYTDENLNVFDGTQNGARKHVAEGWREAVLSVSDLNSWITYYTTILNWEVRNKGEVSKTLLSAWGLPKEANALYALLANPESKTGFVRIADFENVEQRRVREHDQPWETGGIFNINKRVSDMASLSRKLTNAGWQAQSAPVKFTFGPFVIWEWIPRHSDGVRIAFIERVKPILEGWPHLKTTSRTFNSTQMVKDIDKALAFYRDILGFEVYLEHRGPSEEPGESVIGLSHQAMTTIDRHVVIVHPQGVNEGSIELLQYHGYSGRDFSEHAVPPNLGIMMLRFPVADVDALAAYLKGRKISLQMPVTITNIKPYGRVKIIAVRAPDGAWLEFFETLES